MRVFTLRGHRNGNDETVEYVENATYLVGESFCPARSPKRKRWNYWICWKCRKRWICYILSRWEFLPCAVTETDMMKTLKISHEELMIKLNRYTDVKAYSSTKYLPWNCSGTQSISANSIRLSRIIQWLHVMIAITPYKASFQKE